MDDKAYEISSELYEEYDYTSGSKPTVDPKNVVSKFSFKHPFYSVQDADGDIVVCRKKSKNDDANIEIEHSYSTSLDMVGLQIWRGSLLLADWLLDNGQLFSKDSYILELGTGVGLTSIIASMFSPVMCTDINRGDIFKIIQANVSRNKHIVTHPVEVCELDFRSNCLPQEVVALLPRVSTIIAADVIYDDHLTDAFIKTVKLLMDVPLKRTMFVALEKRYVFTIKDCDSVAPCYDYFLDKLKSLESVIIEEMDTDFPQYFQYERVKELVLWKITTTF